MITDLKIQETAEGVSFHVKAVASSSRTCLAGLLAGALKIKISAAPEKGKANQCIKKLLSELLDIAKNDIKIISGSTSPLKNLHVTGISANDLIFRLNKELSK